MQEKRSDPRRRIDQKIEIVDVNSDAALGTLANISQGGFMLLSEKAMPTNKLYQLRIPFPAPIDEATSVELGAESLWCNAATGPGSFWTGFQIIDISDHGSELVTRLIEGWAV